MPLLYDKFFCDSINHTNDCKNLTLYIWQFGNYKIFNLYRPLCHQLEEKRAKYQHSIFLIILNISHIEVIKMSFFVYTENKYKSVDA